MNSLTKSTILVLGGTGKTGRRVVSLLRAQGATVRTASRSGADVPFDWANSSTHGAALEDVEQVYLVPPALELDFGDRVVAFLAQAEEAGVQHVTFLSARGVEHAPPEVAMRAVELHLIHHNAFTYTILRPAFFMQNFTEGAFAFALQDRVLALPTGDGAEAFVDADDIASMAAATLLTPNAHAGAEYELTGPEALTHTQVAEHLTSHGYPVTYMPILLNEWLSAATSSGLPTDYAAFLGSMLAGIEEGNGARTGDTVEHVLARPPVAFSAVLDRDLSAPGQ